MAGYFAFDRKRTIPENRGPNRISPHTRRYLPGEYACVLTEFSQGTASGDLAMEKMVILCHSRADSNLAERNLTSRTEHGPASGKAWPVTGTSM